MLLVKTAIAPPPYASRPRTGGLIFGGCLGLWLFVGLTSASAQQPTAELPQRVPAQFMSYQGAGWLERPERVAEEMPDEMLAVMALEDGHVVADIGAGSGFFARRMARLVAPTGTVYAVDIQPEMLDILRGYVEEEGVTGIVPVLSEFDDPKLPEGEIDWILLVDVYHEFGDHEAMLAKMWQALKRDGRVALLEYRVEDGTGDHIKGDHRMSVRQVLSEWGPAGFDLVELHEFLPSQHMFIFQRTLPDDVARIEPRSVIAEYDILEAISAGHIEVSASESGSETVNLTVRRMRPEPMVITFSVGTYFETPGGAGDMIARRDGAMILLEDGPQVWPVLVRSMPWTGPAPQPQDRFEIRSDDEYIAMRNVMWLFQGINLHPLVEPVLQQLALWIASEDPGYDALVEHAASLPIPVEEAVAAAVAYVNSSGIDVTEKRIWTERERFVPVLRDEGLRRFFEARDRR
jgi:SAM-dependent methyltransferase